MRYFLIFFFQINFKFSITSNFRPSSGSGKAARVPVPTSGPGQPVRRQPSLANCKLTTRRTDRNSPRKRTQNNESCKLRHVRTLNLFQFSSPSIRGGGVRSGKARLQLWKSVKSRPDVGFTWGRLKIVLLHTYKRKSCGKGSLIKNSFFGVVTELRYSKCQTVKIECQGLLMN